MHRLFSYTLYVFSFPNRFVLNTELENDPQKKMTIPHGDIWSTACSCFAHHYLHNDYGHHHDLKEDDVQLVAG